MLMMGPTGIDLPTSDPASLLRGTVPARFTQSRPIHPLVEAEIVAVSGEQGSDPITSKWIYK